MAKKLSLLPGAVAVIALVVPAFASAATVTNGSGEAYAVGTQITSVSNDTTIITEGLGTLECATVEANTELTANSGGSVEMESVGAATTTGCQDEGNAFEITDWTFIFKPAGYDQNGTFGTFKVGITFVAHLFVVTCHVEGTVTGKYHVGTHSLTIGGPLDGHACGQTEINGEYTLSKTGGGEVVLD